MIQSVLGRLKPLKNAVDQAVLDGFFGRHVVVAVGVFFKRVEILARVLEQDLR